MIKPTDEMVAAYGKAWGTARRTPRREGYAELDGLAAAFAIVDRDLDRIKVSINLHESGNGRFIARIAQDCDCGWGSTTTLASWSSLRSLTKTVLAHLAACRGVTPEDQPTPTP